MWTETTPMEPMHRVRETATGTVTVWCGAVFPRGEVRVTSYGTGGQPCQRCWEAELTHWFDGAGPDRP